MDATIPTSEYGERRARLRAALVERDLPGALVVSRGSHGGEWGANVLYLTNHYTPFCQLPDHLPTWAGRGHAAVVVPVDGEETLVVDIPDWRADLVDAPRVEVAIDLWDGVAKALASAGLDRGPLPMIGRDVLPWAAGRRLQQDLPELQLEVADELLDRLRWIKSPAEQAVIRESARVGCDMVNAFMEAAVPGATEADCVAAALATGAGQGALSWDIPVGSGPTVDHFQWHRLPSWDPARVLQTGDMIHPDNYGTVGGYLYDLVRTRIVGRDATPAEREVLEAARGVILHIIEGMRPGVTGAELYERGSAWLAEQGFDAPDADAGGEVAFLGQSFPSFGHGIGLVWERPWLMASDELALAPGMTIAIEAEVGRPGVGTAGFEHEVLITESGAEILTLSSPEAWW
jgi:Xaa-Pro aminopeptidase